MAKRSTSGRRRGRSQTQGRVKQATRSYGKSGRKQSVQSSASGRSTSARQASSDAQSSSGRLGARSGSTVHEMSGATSTGSRAIVAGDDIGKSTLSRRMPVRATRVKGMGLRAKFMLVMALTTVIGLGLFGVLMASTADSFLFNQSKHQGIELAKAAAQMGRIVADVTRASQDRVIDPVELKDRLEQEYLPAVKTWGDQQSFSFIDAIYFESGPLHGIGFGQQEGSAPRGKEERSVTIMGMGSVPLSSYEDIKVYTLTKPIGGRMVPVYRFRVNLPDADGRGYAKTQVVVDVAIETLQRVSNRLYLIILIGAVIMGGIVVMLSNILAGRITRPVTILMRDMQEVAKGNLEHQTRAHSKDEVGVLAGEFNYMTHNLKIAQVALVEQEKAEYELSIAREVQQQLLPAETPEITGYQPAAFYKGAKAVSGDYYDFIPLGEDRWGFIVADVSGKGIPGSMVMAVMRTIVRLVAPKHGANAAETLKETNRLIAKQIKRGMFVTAFYAVLDQSEGKLTFASAGHNPMVIYRAQEKQHQLAGPKGIAIGFNEGPLFDKNIQQMQTVLNPGDSFVLYTDGFPEAMNEQNEEFGDDRFYAAVGSYGDRGALGMVEALVQEIIAHRGRAAQSDDLTILTIGKLQ